MYPPRHLTMTSLVPPEFALPPLSALSFVSSLKSFPGDDLGQKTGQDPDRDRDGTMWMAFATRVQRVVWGTLLDPTFNSTREELWLTSISTPFTQLPFLFLQAVLLHPVFPDSISRPLRIFLMIPALTLSAIAPLPSNSDSPLSILLSVSDRNGASEERRLNTLWAGANFRWGIFGPYSEMKALEWVRPRRTSSRAGEPPG